MSAPAFVTSGSSATTREAIKRELAASYPDATPGTIAAWAGVLRRFAFDPTVGDVLAHPERTSNTVSIGHIDSDYFWEVPDRHCRRVRWLMRRVPRQEFSERLRKQLSARVAFFAVPDESGESAERSGR